MFWNLISSDILSENLTATIFDHISLPLFAPNIFLNFPYNKSNISERD